MDGVLLGNGSSSSERKDSYRHRSASQTRFRSRLSPSLADAFAITAVRGQFAAFLSFRSAASLLRFWLEADATLRSATSSADTTAPAAREIAERSGLTTVLTRADFDKGVAHCQWAVAEELQRNFFEDFKNSSFFAAYELDLLNATIVASNVIEEQSSDKLNLDDVIFCEASLFHFREFIEQQQSSTFVATADVLLAMLNFYLAASSFRREYSTETALADALGLYEKYLSLQAVRPIGVPDSVRRQVEEGISHESGHPEPSTFDSALESIRKLLAGEGVLGQFFHSSQFQEFFESVRRRSFSGNSIGNNDTRLSVGNLVPLGTTPEDDTASIASNGSNPNTVNSSSYRNSSAVRRGTSLRVARIDEVTGAYISEFNNPNFFNPSDPGSTDFNDLRSSLPVTVNDAPNQSNKIKRIFSLRSNSSKTAQLRNQELEAERVAAQIVGEINAIMASSSPTPTPRSSMAFDQ